MEEGKDQILNRTSIVCDVRRRKVCQGYGCGSCYVEYHGNQELFWMRKSGSHCVRYVMIGNDDGGQVVIV